MELLFVGEDGEERQGYSQEQLSTAVQYVLQTSFDELVQFL